MSLFKKPEPPATIQVTFAPQDDITALELARIIAQGYPILVDTASGRGHTMPSFDADKKGFESLPWELCRHFKVTE